MISSGRRISYLYLALFLLGGILPPLFAAKNEGFQESIETFSNTFPIVLPPITLFVMGLKIDSKDDQLKNYYTSPIGIFKILRSYYLNFVKDKKITLLWIVFWFSLVLLAYKAVPAVIM